MLLKCFCSQIKNYFLKIIQIYRKTLDKKDIFLYNFNLNTKDEYLNDDPLAQLVEHLPFKEGAVGSNPTRVTIVCATPSSSGPGPRPFTAVTGVQIPLGSPFI